MKIANVNLNSDILLAPIAGYTDVGFRKVCAMCGAALTYTEMISAKGLFYNGEKTIELLNTTPQEEIKAVQIFGADPYYIQKACQHPALQKFDIIDINCGCPVPKIVKNGEGSALLKNITLAQQLVKAASKSGKPITVKMRIGYEQGDFVAVEFAKAMQDAGAKAITVHGRTKAQMYSGIADRDAIAKVVQCVEIPVIANGDVRSKQDYTDIKNHTKASGVMVARGALGNPFIFNEILDKPANMTLKDAILMHINTMQEFHNEKYILSNIRKHFVMYAKGHHNSKQIKAAAFGCQTLNQLLVCVQEYYENINS